MGLTAINFRPERKTLRRFGLAATVAFGALGAWAFFRHTLFGAALTAETARAVGIALWALAGGCGLLAAVAPRWLRGLYVALTLLTLPVGWVISHVALGIVYYGVLTPVALVFRLIGRDPLRRKRAAAESYWIRREPTTDVSRYYRQF